MKEFDVTGKSVWVAGHTGMVGTAVVRRLADEDVSELITASSSDIAAQSPRPRRKAHCSAETHLNIGRGEDTSILELRLIGDVVGWSGEYVDQTMPDGIMRKLLDVSRLNELGWEAPLSLERGLEMTYQSFLAEMASNTGRV